MKVFCLLLLLALVALVYAAPAPAGQEPTVQLLKYKNDQELEEIQRQIIAQYEQLGGTSQIHQQKTVSYVDPHNIRINVN